MSRPLKSRSVATRMEARALADLKKIYPGDSPATILRRLAEERIAVHRNTRNLIAARAVLAGKKSDRSLL